MKRSNHHQFIEHLLARTMRKGEDYSGILIKPAITPDVLPDTYHLPEHQQFMIPSSSTMVSDLQEPSAAASPGSSRFSQESSKLSQETPAILKKENIIPQKEKEKEKDSRIDDTSSTMASDLQKSSKLSQETPAILKKENIIPQKDISSFETNVEKHNAKRSTKISKDKDKETDAQIISEEINKIDQKRQKIYPEKVYKQKHIASQLEYEEGISASNVGIQEKQIKQNKTGSLLSPVSAKIYHTMQVTRQNLQTSQRYSEEPLVTINIGRIDVRATIPEKPSAKTQQQFSPSLSLKDYLKHRSEVSR